MSSVTHNFQALAARLIEKARVLGEARAAERRLARSDPAARWRRPGLVWPLFTKG
jgi:hypothetical protein